MIVPAPTVRSVARLRSAARSVLRLAAAAAAWCALAAAPACGPSGSVPASLPDRVLDEAPWETAFAPDELTDTLRGVLLEPDQNQHGGTEFPVAAGAQIELVVPRPDGRPPLVKIAETTTASDGSWHLGKAPFEAWGLRASKPGSPVAVGGANLRVPGAVDVAADRDHRMGIQRARTVRGRVALPDGRPLAGVPVDAVGVTFHDRVVTGPDGTFEFLAPDAPLRVTTRGTTCDVVGQIVGPDPKEVVLSTLPVTEFSGRVVTGADLRPIAGARVVWMDEPERSVTTDDDGRFHLAIPRTGRVAAFADGWGWREYMVPRASELEMLLYPAPHRTGTVVGADGKPAGDVRIYGVTADRDGVLTRVPGPRTGPDGTFDFSWLPPSPAWTGERSALAAWHRRQGISEAAVLPADGPLTLHLAGFGVVRGALADASGKPVPSAQASVSWLLDPLKDAEAVAIGLTTERRGLTADDGTFALRGVPLGRPVRVAVTAYGVTLEQTIAAGAPRDALRFTLPAGRRLAGRLVDWKGGPPGEPGRVDAELLDVPGVRFERSVATGPDGAFAFEDVPPGRYALRGEARGFDLMGGTGGDAGDEHLEIAVRKTARLAARLVVEGGGDPPPIQLTVRVENLDEPSQRAGRRVLEPGAAAGEFPVATLRPGRYALLVEGDVWRGRVEEIVLNDGDVRTVDLPLARTLRLRGVVTDEDGKPISGVSLTANPAPGTEGRIVTAWSANDGSIDVAGVVPGTWIVRASPANRAPTEITVTLPSAAPFEIRLPPSGDLRVLVRTDRGDAARGAIVGVDAADGTAIAAWADDAQQLNFRFRTDDAGQIVIRGIPAGSVRVHASIETARLPAKDVVVESGKTVEVLLGDRRP